MSSDQTPPDSRAVAYRRAQWRMLGGVMICYLFFYTGRHNFGWAAHGIMEEFEVTKTQIGWASGCMLWAYGLGQLINGNLADRYGARTMMTLGALFSVAMNWATSYAATFTALVILWTINGYCQSLGFAPGSRLLSNWWPRRERGKAFGFYTFAAASSTILTFLIAIILLDHGLGWRWLMRLPVLLLLVAAIVFFCIVRERPEDMGFESEEDEQGVEDRQQLAESSFSRYRQVFSNGRFMLACLAIGFQNMARYGLILWVPIHYLGEGWKGDAANKWITLALPLGMALGALFFGQLSDRVFDSNRSRPIAISMAAAGLVVAVIWVLPEAGLGLGLTLMFIAGFFVYGPQSSFWPLCPDLLGTKCAGTGVGVMNSVAYLFAGIGEPIFGSMSDAYGTGAVFGLTAIICCAGSVIVLFVRR